MSIQKLVWCVKQLLPLRYETTCGIDGIRQNVVWHMWFGRCFNTVYSEIT